MDRKKIIPGKTYYWPDVECSYRPIRSIKVTRITRVRAYGESAGWESHAQISDLMSREDAIERARFLCMEQTAREKARIEKEGVDMFAWIDKFESEGQEEEEE